ncbi:sensor histidine kinase [Paenibacillus macerans]|uniref:sensor histidine kinase n=1 Tax=Paenibacillus macerans TaxID=44252 RepID=UPI003D323B0F
MKAGGLFTRKSIVFRFFVSFTIILAILFTVLLLSNIYSLEVVRTQSISNSRNTLGIYVENIHSKLNLYAKDLTEVFENQVDAATEYERLNVSDRYFREIALLDALKAKASNNDSSDGVFIKLSGDGATLVQFGNRTRSEDKLDLVDFLKEHDFLPDPDRTLDEWTDFEVQGAHYLFRYITYEKVSFGTFVKADSLLAVASGEGQELGPTLLSAREGGVLASTDEGLLETASSLSDLREQVKKSYLFISEPIAEFGDITHMMAKQSIFSGLKLIQWIIISLAAISVVAIPLVLKLLARDILQPVLELVKAAKDVEKGRTSFPEPSGHFSIEFMKLFHSFDSMVREITDLKIHTYEEKIERSRTELKYLQMQIRPHFFLNAISTINSLTYQNKNEEIRMLIQLLSQHLRYMFKGGLVLVPLEEEMKHVDNYVCMQEIRNPDQIFCMTDIDMATARIHIPQFLVQTFVENIFKHALTFGEMLSIFIRSSLVELEDKRYLHISIEDNGGGFPTNMLQAAGHSSMESAEASRQVGISNIRRTLQLLYKREDLLKLSNAEPLGARVEILIPMEGDEEMTS